MRRLLPLMSPVLILFLCSCAHKTAAHIPRHALYRSWIMTPGGRTFTGLLAVDSALSGYRFCLMAPMGITLIQADVGPEGEGVSEVSGPLSRARGSSYIVSAIMRALGPRMPKDSCGTAGKDVATMEAGEKFMWIFPLWKARYRLTCSNGEPVVQESEVRHAPSGLRVNLKKLEESPWKSR